MCLREVFVYRQLLATAASCLISLCAGMTFGISAVMIPQLREDKSIEYLDGHDSWIASISTLGVIVGSLCCGTILDSLGRKWSLVFLTIPFIIGWSIIAGSNSTNIILIGRFITGLSSGGIKPVVMVYIGEVVNPKLRSSALFLPGLTSHIGILVSHIIGYYTYWKTSALVCILPSAISMIMCSFLKESPLWLIAKGRTEEGIQNYRWFRGTAEESEEELKTVLERQIEKPNISAKETLKIMSTKSFIVPMLILIILLISVNLSGVHVIVFYSLDIFGKAFSGNVDPFTLTIAMDCFRAGGSLGICTLGNVIPKKIAFLVGTFAASICVLGYVACSLLHFDGLWLPVVCIISYITFSSVIATICWTFLPELLPSYARAFGSGLCTALNFLLLFGILKMLPDLMKWFGQVVVFGFFGVSMLVTGVILCFVLPETKGKTLQSIEDSYKSKGKNNKEVSRI